MFRLLIVALTFGLVMACSSPPKKQINKEKIRKNASETMEKVQ
jgi:hypothetical protein